MKTLIHFVLFLLFVFTCYQSGNSQSYFSDDFESGLSKWIRGGNNWDTLSSTYTSSNHCATDSRLGNYTHNSAPTMTISQPLNLSNTSFPVLSFYHRYQLASHYCGGGVTQYDYAYLEISTNGGFNWSQIKNWTLNNKSWTHEQFSLSNYKSSLVQVRFKLSSSNCGSAVSDGWYIDDVKIQEYISLNPTFIFPFCDSFEHNKINWFTGGFNWDTTSISSNSGNYSVSDSRIGNYVFDSDPSITMSGVLDLSKTNFPVLSFYHRYQLASFYCGGGVTNYDRVYLDISTDGGFSWSNLFSWTLINNAWTYEQFNLSNYKTDKVKIRYKISSHNCGGATLDGAYLDDVCIYDLNPNYINLNLKLLLEGMYDPGINEMASQDTFKVYLRNVNSPYNLRDSAKGVISPFTFSGQFYFHNAPTGNYHLVIKHRNSIETWSKSGGVSLVKGDGLVHNYDFTTDSNKAFGNNQIKKGSKWCFFGGDVNQDGTVDGSDLGIVDNDASLGVSGYVISDVTGDYFVDGSDASIVDNNGARYVTLVRP